MAPFRFNMASLGIVPALAFTAKTAAAQVDIIYAVADDPATPQDKAMSLARLAGKMLKKMAR